MKTQVSSIVITSAIALFTASANADSIHSVFNFQQDKVTKSQNNKVVDPKTSIQDYVDAARQEQVKERLTANVRALSGVDKAL